MLQKIKEWCVFATYGEQEFNKAHPWYCVITIAVVILAAIWKIFDLIWRWTWTKKD